MTTHHEAAQALMAEAESAAEYYASGMNPTGGGQTQESRWRQATLLDTAQVHATLALAEATKALTPISSKKWAELEQRLMRAHGEIIDLKDRPVHLPCGCVGVCECIDD